MLIVLQKKPQIKNFNDTFIYFIAVTYFTPGYAVIDELEKDHKKYFPLIFRYIHHANNSTHLDQLTEIYKNYYFGNTRIRDNVHAFSKVFFLL